jgi:hypothetical protein
MVLNVIPLIEDFGESLIGVRPLSFQLPAFTVPLFAPTLILNPKRSKNCHLTAIYG